MRQQLENYRRKYPSGCRVELVSMDDVQAPPIGTKGTVIAVDDACNLIVKWDNGNCLNVILGIDEVRKLKA